MEPLHLFLRLLLYKINLGNSHIHNISLKVDFQYDKLPFVLFYHDRKCCRNKQDHVSMHQNTNLSELTL